MELTNSKRILRSASYVTVELTEAEQRQHNLDNGRAIEKINFLRGVAILPWHIAKARDDVAKSNLNTAEQQRLYDGFQRLERIANALTDGHPEGNSNLTLAPIAAAIPARLLIDVAKRVGGPADLRIAAFEKQMKTAPVGRLHLERIEMYPAGVQRGELMFTVPLAPKETVTISHKEWSTSGEEYERVVQDYFESYSEKGVAEKIDASMSVENESKHASAFNFSTSASGGYGPVSMTVSTGLTMNDEDRSAQKDSSQRAREITEKASARTRQEHKISAKLETKRGAEDSSFRTITNPHDDRALRIDYYRMMRKWRTDLFRYGLRLTFDIAIPNPGARLWAQYRRIREIESQIGQPFVFPLKYDSLNELTWANEATKHGVALSPPPPAVIHLTISRTLGDPKGGTEIFDFVAPDGYTMESNTGLLVPNGTAPVSADGVWYGTGSQPNAIFPVYSTVVATPATGPAAGHGGTFTVASRAPAGEKQATWVMMYMASEGLGVVVRMDAHLTPAAYSRWQMQSWTALREAAFAAFQEKNARLVAERDRLWGILANKDTLTLRRLEREELIRQTIYWLLGPDRGNPAPINVGEAAAKLVTIEKDEWADDTVATAILRYLTDDERAAAAGFGDIVKYIHHAVEWENLLFFLYPYFWGSLEVAREKMLFEHPDPTHREFLRAGYARVVVPIRPGFEETFTELLDTGSLSITGKIPYITIAEEVAAFARTNYAGVPPANPEKHARPLLFPEQRRTWATMQKVVDLIEEYHGKNKDYPLSLSVLAGAPFDDAWGNPLVYRNPGSGNDYDLISLGADGAIGGEGLDADISAAAPASLVASWFDYTPTSGIDIEIDAKMENVT